MNQKPKKKLAAALATKAAAEKALLLAEAAAKRARAAKVEFKLARKTWKLARKAARRTAKEARKSQKELAKVAALLKSVHPKPRKRATAKTVMSRTKTRKSPVTIAAMQPTVTETATTQAAPIESST